MQGCQASAKGPRLTRERNGQTVGKKYPTVDIVARERTAADLVDELTASINMLLFHVSGNGHLITPEEKKKGKTGTMSETVSPTRPRRKQAVPLKYEGSGDDSDDDLPSDILDIDFAPEPRSSSSGNAQARQRRPQGQKRLLVKFKIKKCGSKKAYVEHAAEDEDFSPRSTRGQKRRKKRASTAKRRTATSSQKSAKSKAPATPAAKGYETGHTPKGLKKQIVSYARANTVDQAAKKFRVPVHKVKHWLKADRAVPPPPKHEVKESCLVPDPFPASFKLFSIGLAEEKGAKEASALLSLEENLVEQWLKAKPEITRKANSDNIPHWETDVFVGVRRDAFAGHEISVSDLMFRAESLKVDDTKIHLQWAQRCYLTISVFVYLGRKLTKAIVCARAQRLFQKHGHPEFRAGDGWHRAWKRRCEQLYSQDFPGDEQEDIDIEDESSAASHGQVESADTCAEKSDASAVAVGDHSQDDYQLPVTVVPPPSTDQRISAPSPPSVSMPSTSAAAEAAEPYSVLLTSVPAPQSQPAPEQHPHCTASPVQPLQCAVTSPQLMHPMTTSSQPTRQVITAAQQPGLHLPHSTLDRTGGHSCVVSNPHYPPMCSQSQHVQPPGPSYTSPEMGLEAQRLSRPFYQLHQMTAPVQSSHMFYGSYWADQGHMRCADLHKNEVRQPPPIAPPFYDSYANYDHSIAPTCHLEVSNQPYTDYGQPAVAAAPCAENCSTTTPGQKKKNERYLPDFKLQVVKYALQSTFKKTAEHFGVHHSTVAEWCRDREKLERLFPEERGCLVKNLEASSISPAEQMFVAWLTDCNASNAKLDAAQVKDKVKEIIRYFGEDQVKTNCRWLYVWHKKRLEMEQMIEDLPELQSSSGKEFRIAFPPAVKLEIVKVAERLKFSEASKYFQIDRNSLSDWSKTQEKLRAMVKEGKVRKKEVSKSKKALEAEREVYQWYQQCRSSGYKPGPNEVRARAAETYRKYGDTTMKCSIGWYSRWSRRFGIQLRYEKDDEILEWVLAQLEQNRTVTHNEIQAQAIAKLSQTRTGFKCSAGWPIRFCKRHQALLQKIPTLDTPLPAVLEQKISLFRHEVQELQEQCGVTSAAIGAMDEVPLYFSSGAGGGTGSGSLLVRRCGFEQAQAIVFLSCLSDGGVLPPLALLKGSSSVSEVNGMFVLCQEEMKVDHSTVKYWAERVWSRFVPSPSFLFVDPFEPHKQFAASASSDIKVALTPPACASQTHPVVVWLRRKFQALVNKMSADRNSARSIPTVQEMLECIAAAWRQLQATSHDAVQKSFVVTGAVVAGDSSEDDIVGKAELLPDVDEEDFT
ncbi:hypothetical protein HPB48_004663 [Haemaphysalis longicornis]|uniref:HTH CENPB-type domain-containing protein n=1 Tax=Haemaphysalis longicornis TaxID=44386 RepID=A0A9J6G2T5_HAELO|nr:hypothetical protein HPB48_004663 [Haemaphysalis longicornis]